MLGLPALFALQRPTCDRAVQLRLLSARRCKDCRAWSAERWRTPRSLTTSLPSCRSARRRFRAEWRKLEQTYATAIERQPPILTAVDLEGLGEGCRTCAIYCRRESTAMDSPLRPASSRLGVGRAAGMGSPHQNLAGAIDAGPDVVGGMMRGDGEGSVFTNENSGHFMNEYGFSVIHIIWGR
jgi:hypothetical protein